MEALGLIETKGFAGVLEAGNALLAVPGVELIAYEKIGGGYVALLARGPEEALRQAIDDGARQAERVGELISVHVIINPAPRLVELLLSRPRGDKTGL